MSTRTLPKPLRGVLQVVPALRYAAVVLAVAGGVVPSPVAATEVAATEVAAADGAATTRARPAGAAADEAAIQRELQLKRIARLRQNGKGSDAPTLMPLLKDPDGQVRRQAELAIWALWGRSGQAALDRLLRSAVDQLGRDQVDDAIDTLTRIIDREPAFAEAWNKRATARFLAGDLIGALDDCEQVLARVPDHFGSLAGYGHIYFRLDDLDRALHYWERALAVNPNLDGIARSIDAVRRMQVSRGRLTT